jgi:hypothetical protein
MMCRVAILMLVVVTLLGAVVPFLLGADPAEPQEVPYPAYVTKRAAVARSGPGMNHYPTDALPRGEQVEVWDQQGEWLAIQAPAESFSWVPGDRLKLAADGKSAEVQRDDVPSWVGSNLDPVERHTSQVKLRRGERVTVVGRRELSGEGDPPQVWIKIVPPQGERRWIAGADVSREAPPDRAAELEKAETPVPTPSRREETISPNGWTDRTSGITRRRSWADEEAPESTGARRRTSPTGVPPAGVETEAAIGSWTHLLNYPANASFDDRLARLQLALSRAVAGGGTTAQLDLLERRADELLQAGKSSYERGQATLLLEGIREFRQLARRRKATVQRASYGRSSGNTAIGTGVRNDAEPATAFGLLERLATEVQSLAGADLAVMTSGDGKKESLGSPSPYLAEGWLMPVSSPTRAAPPYVLMDRDGHPVAFVTPAPGVNLRRYVDKQVGIQGQPAFEILDRQHVVAHRAIDLSRHREDAPATRSASPWIRNREPEPVGVLR